ncbi:MAG: hypothetical protein NTY19_09150 [Planctomycetota bacterium]|nr:hypothetical protein [Planctomycetota bacterium]
MTTRERLLKYRELRKSSPAAAEKFLVENQTDERFVSLVKLGNAFVAGLKTRVRERLSEEEKEELQGAVEVEFMRGWADVLDFANARAKKAARRVFA